MSIHARRYCDICGEIAKYRLVNMDEKYYLYICRQCLIDYVEEVKKDEQTK